MQQMEIWLVILFLSRKKFHAQQTFVLSSSMKLGPDLHYFCSNKRVQERVSDRMVIIVCMYDIEWSLKGLHGNSELEKKRAKECPLLMYPNSNNNN